jgi:hypothetical protein
MNIQEIIKNTENLSKQDIAGSIDYLVSFKSHEKYYPWGAYTLSKLYKENKQIIDYENILLEIIENHNNFEPAISNLISLYKHYAFDRDNKFSTFKKMLENVIHITREKKVKTNDWFINDQLLALFILTPKDGLELIEKIYNDFNQHDKNLVLDLYWLILNTKESLANRLNTNYPKSWRLTFESNSQILNNENTFLVNLSKLKISSNLSDIPTLIVDNFVFGLSSLLYNIEFEDDFGYKFWDNVSYLEHIYTLKFWQFLRSRILILANDGKINFKETYPQNIIFDSKFETNKLFVRAGNVEVWALWNYLNNKNDFLQIVEYVCSNIFQMSSQNISVDVKDTYWPKTNPVNNIIKLITNAGWYAKPEFSKTSMIDWCERYLLALRSGNIIIPHPVDLPTLIPLVPGLSSKKLTNWNLNQFIRSIKNKNVLFVTPFADQIEKSWNDGSLIKFWHETGLDFTIKNLKLIKPPVSIYPYYPDDSWSQSFEKLCVEVKSQLENFSYNYFLASCGAYGLPIVEHTHKNHGIISLYNGHIMNMFFGIYTDSFKDFMQNHPSNYWINGNLHIDFPEIKKIDSGRYAE